jgi:hypothetical protein
MKHETVSEESSSSAAALEYLFSAAGLWAGSIRDGVVKVRPVSIDASKVRLSHPKSFTRTKEGWEWVFRDFEPTLEDDLTIFVRPVVNRYPVYENGPSEGGPWIGDYVAEGLQWKKWEPYGGTWSMHRRDFEANASSTLPPEAGKTYSAENVILGRGAWVEGVSGQGIGESLTLKLKQPVPVKKLGIRTGYTESEELYLANSRPAALDVTVNGGKPRNVRIPDECLTREFFFFDLPPTEGPVKTIQLKITEVYPGTQFEDTAISQLILVQPLSKAPKFQPAR